jgi:dihydrofolate synthase/folylpolyglutamate synthase
VTTVAVALSDWLAKLETISSKEIDLGLDRVVRVLERLALPSATRVFHIAGTNGKGSTVAMLESLLRHNGFRVGCYTSPHIQRFNERIRIDGVEVPDEEIIAAFEQIDALRDGEALTYFEFGTLAALVVFAKAGVDTLVLEIGLGGRLDAVNAVEPTAGIITNIALDHCEWLGDNIAAIAVEKAGIMRSDKPVIFSAREMPPAIIDRAGETGAKLLAAGRDFDWHAEGDTWSWRGTTHSFEGLARPSLAGEHQLANASGVLALIEAAGLEGLLEPGTISASLQRVRLEGRLQKISANGNWIVDVAHNPDAARVLAAALRADAHAGQTVAILGMLDDKDVEGVVAHLADEVDHWIAVTADSQRAISANELGRRVANASNAACLVADSLVAAMDRAQELTNADDRILVTGSFYLVGPALNQLYSRR